MSLENERRKCQLPSCENRMSIKDRVLKILAHEYIYNYSHQRWAHTWKNSVCVCPSVYKSYDTSRHSILLIFGQKLGIEILRSVTEPDFR